MRQNERQVAKFHFQVRTRFILFRLKAVKWYIICQGCCLIWGPKSIISLRNSFVFYWFLKWSMSHISFSSLATCRSFCENRSQMTKARRSWWPKYLKRLFGKKKKQICHKTAPDLTNSLKFHVPLSIKSDNKLLMHESKGISNLPSSSLHLCSPFQQNRKVKIHYQFTFFL